jgi:GntR family transcriptional regulator
MFSNVAVANYLQLAQSLRERIENGELSPGDRLPSEAELAAENGISRGTVVRAIEQLVRQGLVTRRQGAGTFVASRSLHRRAGHLLSFTESARLDGHSSQQELIGFTPVDQLTAIQFGISGPSMQLERIRMVDGVPCAIHRSMIPQSVCTRIQELREAGEALSRPDLSIYALFEKNGLRVEEASERVTARLATPEEASLLEVSQPAAVIVVFRVSKAGNGQIVEAIEAVYRSDFYTYDTHLVRSHSGSRTGPRVVAHELS